jgi:hypothetical protein
VESRYVRTLTGRLALEHARSINSIAARLGTVPRPGPTGIRPWKRPLRLSEHSRSWGVRSGRRQASRTPTAINHDDVWAVGRTYVAGQQRSSFLHWDGLTWSRVRSPAPASGSSERLLGVSAPDSNDVWAVGERDLGSVVNPIVFRRHRGSWTSTIVPGPGRGCSGGGYEARLRLCGRGDSISRLREPDPSALSLDPRPPGSARSPRVLPRWPARRAGTTRPTWPPCSPRRSQAGRAMAERTG